MTATSTELVEVTVETLLGARYVFPDMPRDVIGSLQSSGFTCSGQLVLVNASNVTLVLPSRIVKSISYDGEVKWTNAAALRELQKADGT